MQTDDLPPYEPGDELDRALKRADSQKRSDRLYLVGMGIGAMTAVGGAIVSVSGGPPWALVAGFAAGIVVGLVFSVFARRQLDHDPSGEIAPPPPEGRPPDSISGGPSSPTG